MLGSSTIRGPYAGRQLGQASGLTAGGKTVPDTINQNPRVFATLTAPFFDPFHNHPSSDAKQAGRCRCGRTHAEGDPLIGSPLQSNRYNYQGAVLRHAHAPALWSRFMLHLRRAIARAAGLTQRSLSSAAKISYAKVPEYSATHPLHRLRPPLPHPRSGAQEARQAHRQGCPHLETSSSTTR